MSATHLFSVAARTIHATEYCLLVTRSCHHETETAYVAPVGTAQMVDDRHARQRWWREDWRACFPDGPRGDGDGDGLIRCTPSRLELMHQVQHVWPELSGLRDAVIVHNSPECTVEPQGEPVWISA